MAALGAKETLLGRNFRPCAKITPLFRREPVA